jgi:hypothetical protein
MFRPFWAIFSELYTIEYNPMTKHYAVRVAAVTIRYLSSMLCHIQHAYIRLQTEHVEYQQIAI